MITLTINGQKHQVDADPQMPLLWVIRDMLNMTGTKYSCGRAYCGACIVHVDGEAARSCSTMVGAVTGKTIVTIEGVDGRVAEAVKKAWAEIDVAQCGYCQSGQIMAAITLLNATAKPTDSDIDAAMSGVLCRCGTYPRIRAAIKRASELA